MMEELPPLVAAAQAGDLAAFGRVVARFQDMAFACAYGRLGDSGMAEEAAQDAFVEAWRHLPSLREPIAFPAWFRTVIARCCNRLSRGKRPSALSLEAAGEADAAPASDPVEESEMKDFVRAAVDSLPEHERTVTTLYYMAGYPQAEIASVLELPLTTVKKRLHDARRQLRRRMMSAVADHLQGGRPSRDDRFAEKVQRSLILLTARDGTGARLFTMHPDGSHLKAMTEAGTYTDAHWLPDGRKLYGKGCVVEGLMIARHHVMSRDGSVSEAFGPDIVAGQSSVSRDGSKVAFISHKDYPELFPEFRRSEIYVADLDSGTTARLTFNVVEDCAPTWLRDGRILFARDVSGDATRHQLFVVSPDGTGESPFPAGAPDTLGNWPAVSPSGDVIAFMCEGQSDSGAEDLWVMATDGSDKKRLTDLGLRVSASPSWSPDGSEIALVAGHQVYVVRADGASGLKPEPIEVNLGGVNAPVWGP